MDAKIRVLLVEDEEIVGEAIAALLAMETGLTVVGTALNAEMCLRRAHALRPDVILLDLRLPDQPGVAVIGALLEDNPDVRIVILTGYADEYEVAVALRAGAVGYVLKTQGHKELVRAIEHAYEGKSSVPPQIAKIMLQMLNPPKPRKLPHVAAALSQSELRVLAYVAQGLENKEIAQLLQVTRTTIHAHVSSILAKLHLENRTQAAIFAIQHGLFPLASQQQKAPGASSFGAASSPAGPGVCVA